jgi:hypothetical protein
LAEKNAHFASPTAHISRACFFQLCCYFCVSPTRDAYFGGFRDRKDSHAELPHRSKSGVSPTRDAHFPVSQILSQFAIFASRLRETRLSADRQRSRSWKSAPRPRRAAPGLSGAGLGLSQQPAGCSQQPQAALSAPSLSEQPQASQSSPSLSKQPGGFSEQPRGFSEQPQVSQSSPSTLGAAPVRSEQPKVLSEQPQAFQTNPQAAQSTLRPLRAPLGLSLQLQVLIGAGRSLDSDRFGSFSVGVNGYERSDHGIVANSTVSVRFRYAKTVISGLLRQGHRWPSDWFGPFTVCENGDLRAPCGICDNITLSIGLRQAKTSMIR